MRVFITRPERDATRWAVQLQQRGIAAEALPLIVIGPLADRAPLQAAWETLAGRRAAMFVSGAAVDGFFAARPARIVATDFVSTRFWAPGPGTARGLRQAGIADAQIDTPPADAGQFDSEALWHAAGPRIRPGDTVLVVRGSDGADDAAPADTQGRGREWMAQQLRAAGARVDYCAAYRRMPPVWSTAQAAAVAQRLAAPATLVFSSSEAIAHFMELLPALPARAEGPVALCTHPRIAETARAAGFRRVLGTRPTVDSVADVLRGLGRNAPAAEPVHSARR